MSDVSFRKSPTWIRLVSGLLLLGLPTAAGFLGRSLWLLPMIGAIFVAGYIGGKHRQWRDGFWRAESAARVRLLLLTWAIQSLLAGVFFLIGLGAGRLAGRTGPLAHITGADLVAMAVAALAVLALNALLARLPHPMDAALEEIRKTAPGAPPSEEAADSLVSSTPVTPETFYSADSSIAQDHMRSALKFWPLHEGRKPRRALPKATEASLNAAEERLGFRLPNLLRDLYKIQDGGYLPLYWVALVDDPGPDYDDWADAFANDYNSLAPLEDLRSLEEHYEDYDEPRPFPEADKLIVLAKRYDIAALLDYRSGPEPGVLLVDLDNEPDASIRKSFPDFASFFAALRRDKEQEDRHKRIKARQNQRPTSETLDPRRPARFWVNAVSNRADAATPAIWAAAGRRLGIVMPEALYPVFAVLNGGDPAFQLHVGLGEKPSGEPRIAFPGGLLAPELWISLKELSDRIDFAGETPYAALHAEPDGLIVLAARYDEALTLDGRGGGEPRFVFFTDLTDPASARILGTGAEFLAGLRRRESDPLPLSDERLSPRRATPETFWSHGGGAPGVDKAALAAQAERLDVGAIPEFFCEVLRLQNGGAVRFRFAPPILESETGFDAPRANPAAPEWRDLFPGGLWPIERWTRFTEFAAAHDVARGQNPQETLMPENRHPHRTGLKERLIVIGAEGARALTLLDVSMASSSGEGWASRVDYAPEEDAYRFAIPPRPVQDRNDGVEAVLRARLDEL